MNNSLVFLPVDEVRLQDLFDWAVSVQRCKTTTVILSPISSPRKNGIKIQKNNNNVGCRTLSNEREIALFRYGDKVFAVNADCPHAGGPLDLGDIEEFDGDRLCVKCPWHGWKIDLATGGVLHPKGHGNRSTVVYPVRVGEGGKLFLGFDGLDRKYFRVDEAEF